MPVDAFGRQALTVDEVIEQLTLMSSLGLGDKPLWTKGERLYKPVKRVVLINTGRPCIEVYHG